MHERRDSGCSRGSGPAERWQSWIVRDVHTVEVQRMYRADSRG